VDWQPIAVTPEIAEIRIQQVLLPVDPVGVPIQAVRP
jgi:hypothetical protein